MYNRQALEKVPPHDEHSISVVWAVAVAVLAGYASLFLPRAADIHHPRSSAVLLTVPRQEPPSSSSSTAWLMLRFTPAMLVILFVMRVCVGLHRPPTFCHFPLQPAGDDKEKVE